MFVVSCSNELFHWPFVDHPIVPNPVLSLDCTKMRRKARVVVGNSLTDDMRPLCIGCLASRQRPHKSRCTGSTLKDEQLLARDGRGHRTPTKVWVCCPRCQPPDSGQLQKTPLSWNVGTDRNTSPCFLWLDSLLNNLISTFFSLLQKIYLT